MIEIDTIALNADPKTISGLIAKNWSSGKNLYGQDIKSKFDRAKGYGLGSTAKFFRENLKQAFIDNPFGWPENSRPDRGKFGNKFSIKELIAGNKPTKGAKTIRRGRRRKLGGRLGSLMRHDIVESTGYMRVGMVDKKLPMSARAIGGNWSGIMSKFQESGFYSLGYGTRQDMRRYFGAIGLPMSSNPSLKRPARKLFEPMQAKYPPQKEFEKRYLKKMEEFK